MTTSSTNVCRACLVSQVSFTHSLHQNVLAEMYRFCTSIDVLQDDLPRSLCEQCYQHITKFSEFKNTCIQSQKSLLIMLNDRDDTVKLETDVIVTLEEIKDKKNIIKVKSEEPFYNFFEEIVPVKAEEIAGNFNVDLFEDDDDDKCDVVEDAHFKQRKLKMRTNKLGKLKPLIQPRVKIRTPRKHTYSCDFCNKKFNYLDRFEAHKLEHEGKTTIINCLPCNKTFMTWSGLRRHKESEHTIICLENLKCNECGKICKSQQTLKNHKMIHGERKVYVCDVCGKGFTTKFILMAHIDTHKEKRERLFTCEHCGKKFYTNTILLSHVSRQHKGRSFICQICNYPFTDKSNLAKHLLIHDGKKLYKCEICNKSYGKQCSLVEHKRTHSGERPYACSFCTKSFVSKRRLDDHHRVHTGERPYKCTICEQCFTQRGTLKRHMKVHDRST